MRLRTLNILLNHKLYIVGGFVRDLAMNKQSKDIDCELYNTQPSELEGVLSDNDIEFKIDHQSKFPVYRIELEEGEVEIGFPRRDNKTGNKHNDFEVVIDPNMTFKEAFKRRDFTMNAIGISVGRTTIIDEFDGISDINNKILRPVDKNTFKEDPLRLFRAFQFVARFGFDYQPVLDIIDEEFLQSTKHLSKDSIFKEMKKGIEFGTYFDKALDFLKESGLLRIHFPELDKLSECQQSLKHHAEGDVWKHTKMVVINMMKRF